MPVAFIDLDRTLLRGASGPAITRALVAEGLVSERHRIPGQSLVYGFFDRFGENALSMGLARGAVHVTKGWSQESTRAAGCRAVPELLEHLAPYAPDRLDALRADGLRLVLATTTPEDVVRPLAEALGFDDVIATRYEAVDGRYTGRLHGGFVWGLGKLNAVKRWLEEHGEALEESHAFSDSVFDVPLLSSVGHPHAVNADYRLLLVAKARGWALEQWDRPEGVHALFGIEAYDLLRPFVRPEMFPYASFTISGIENVPTEGPVILAANHRSYFDVAALAVLAAKIKRPVRALAKKELFDVPVLSQAARALGAIRVDRQNSPETAMDEATAALRAGEVVVILPEGTIPRGPAFFDPTLRGKSGVARLAQATGAPVVPVGLWGTEVVWPRSSRLPTMTTVLDPPGVSVTVGSPLEVPDGDPKAATAVIMAAIADLLPRDARSLDEITDEEMTRTYPSGKVPTSGDDDAAAS